MVLLSGPPTRDERGCWTGSRSSAPGLAMGVDPASGFLTSLSVAGAGSEDGPRIDPVHLELRDHGVAVRIELPRHAGEARASPGRAALRRVQGMPGARTVLHRA